MVIDEVEPKLKYALCVEVPVLVIVAPCTVNVIAQAEPEVPALKTPVLAILALKADMVIVDAESAVNVAELVILAGLLDKLKVAPLAAKTPEPELVILEALKAKLKVEP